LYLLWNSFKSLLEEEPNIIQALVLTAKLKHQEKLLNQEFLLARQDVLVKVIKVSWGLVSTKSSRKNVNMQVLANQLETYSI
jgi:hypothetical protein